MDWPSGTAFTVLGTQSRNDQELMGMGETYLNVLGTQVNVGGQQQLGVFGSQSKRFRQRHDIFFVNRTAGGENWKKRRKISQSAQERLAQSGEVRMSRLSASVFVWAMRKC